MGSLRKLLLVAVLLLSVLPLVSNIQNVKANPGTIFSDGFESGDGSGWDGVVDSAISYSSSSHHGSWSCRRLLTASGSKGPYEVFDSYYTTLYYFCAFKISAFEVGENTHVMYPTGTSLGIAVAIIGKDATGTYWQMNWRDGGSWLNEKSYQTITEDKWYQVKLKVKVGATDGESILYVNGVNTIEKTGLDNDDRGENHGLKVLMDTSVWSASAWTYIDCVEVATEDIGYVYIYDDAGYYYVETDKIYLKIKKANGCPTSWKLNTQMDTELAYQGVSPAYSLWLAEYEIIDETDFSETAYGSAEQTDVVTTKESDTQIKAFWEETPTNITWWYDFYPLKDYFKIYCLREIKQTKITGNQQQCLMFSTTFDTGGHTDYEGNVIESWARPSGTGTNLSLWYHVPVFTYIKNGSGDYYPFTFLEKNSPAISVASILTGCSANCFTTMARRPPTLLNDDQWEFEWETFNIDSMTAIRYVEDMSYDYTTYVIGLEGSRSDIQTVSETLFTDLGGLTTYTASEEYHDVSWSTGNQDNFALTVNNGYIQTKRLYQPISGGTGAYKCRGLIVYPDSGMMPNFCEWNFTKDSTTLVPFSGMDSYGYTDGDTYQLSWEVETVGTTTQNTTIRVEDSDKQTLKWICTADNITAVEAEFLLGSGLDNTKYSAELLGTNDYLVTFTDALMGDLHFKIEAISNCALSYDSETKTITVTPSSSPYEFHIILVEINAPAIDELRLSVIEDDNNITSISVNTYYHWEINITDTDTLNDIKNVTIRIENNPANTIAEDTPTFTEANEYWFRFVVSTQTWEWYDGSAWSTTETYLNISGCSYPSLLGTSGWFKFNVKLSKIASHTSTWEFSALIYDSLNQNDTATFTSITIYCYSEMTVQDTHSWVNIQPTVSNKLIDEGTVQFTVLSNANYDIQIKGDGNLTKDADTIPLANVKYSTGTWIIGSHWRVDADEWILRDESSLTSLTTNYVTVLSDLSAGAENMHHIKLWLTVPNATPSGTYTYTLWLQVIEHE